MANISLPRSPLFAIGGRPWTLARKETSPSLSKGLTEIVDLAMSLSRVSTAALEMCANSKQFCLGLFAGFGFQQVKIGQFSPEGKNPVVQDQSGGDAIFIHVKIDLIEGRFRIVFFK